MYFPFLLRASLTHLSLHESVFPLLTKWKSYVVALYVFGRTHPWFLCCSLYSSGLYSGESNAHKPDVSQAIKRRFLLYIVSMKIISVNIFLLVFFFLLRCIYYVDDFETLVPLLLFNWRCKNQCVLYNQ